MALDMPPEVKAALEQCRWMMVKGSKSFSLAARLFDPDTRSAAFFLYGWCRYCDDQVDDSAKQMSQPEMEAQLEALRESTRSAFSDVTPREPVFIALQYIVRRYAIPAHYPLELIEGMAMDVRGNRYPTFDDLLLYCYRVAGTVGLMMSHVMGLRDENALKPAADLGIAMQLTNIARDIVEDADMGRVYVPLAWLCEAGIAPEEISLPQNREKLAGVMGRLLGAAAGYYRSGDEGLWHLSFRSACAVAAARHVYAEIGNLLLQKGAAAWNQRTYVRGSRKLRMVARGMLQLLRSVPARAVEPWAASPIRTIWRHSDYDNYSGLRLPSATGE
jgi:15-cis-phytoene synthase